ncbi:hypothetical protein O181_052319 [Austropuccinia psidii MF-1]|uniref:Uncharacterized protein n=1 Tax=Austropuccinia psidii MF-1 TaxID=1389203 RepID=A0A9Q3HRJ4_9BASI|nr:hypothetical protein [Austropuccinia psidii MF-1]
MRPLGPFWPKSSGGNPPAPKAKWAHLSQFWPPISTIPKMAKRTPGTTFGPLSTPGLWKPPEATSSGPERFALNSGEDLSFTNVLHTKGARHGAYMVSYTIMHQCFSVIQW